MTRDVPHPMQTPASHWPAVSDAALRPFHVGGLETGTARVLQRLVAQTAATLAKAPMSDTVRQICAEVKHDEM